MIPLVRNAHDTDEVLYYCDFEAKKPVDTKLLNKYNEDDAMKCADSGIGVKTLVSRKDLGKFKQNWGQIFLTDCAQLIPLRRERRLGTLSRSPPLTQGSASIVHTLL